MDTRSLTTVFRAGPLAEGDVVAFRLERRLGRPASAEVEVRAEHDVDPDELLGQPALLEFGRDASEHAFVGVVESVTVVASPTEEGPRGTLHRLRVTSQMGLLDREVDCRIFQDKDVRAIVTALLGDLGFPPARLSWNLVAKYPKREVCVQYGESALAFVSRLLEEEGIFFSSELVDGREVIVFEDDSTAARPIDGEEKLRFRPQAGMLSAENAVSFLSARRRVTTGKVVLRDYDFQKPELDLTTSKAAGLDDDLEVYDYPGLYTDPKEGARLAEVRLQALTAERHTLDLESGCPFLVPGRRVAIEGAPEGLDGRYFLTGTLHELREGRYSVRAEAVPADVKYRCPQVTPRPVIRGPQTAEVVAPKGSPAEEIHTDALGRCKVRFPWDRYAAPDDTASFWIRVSQLQTSGSMILPRVGWEVIVDFAEGNPDRPLVTGRVYNGRYMPPYALPEGKSRTALGTASSPGGGGRNEIRLEDKAGSEEVMIHSQKNTALTTGNNKTKSTAVNETKSVGVNAELTVGASQSVKVTNGYLDTVKGAQSIKVGGNRTIEVNAVIGMHAGGASSTNVGGNQMEMDGNPIQALLALAVKTVKEAAEKEVENALAQLDQAVNDKVEQVMGPINDLQDKASAVGDAMHALSNGDLSAAGDALGAAGALPSVDDLGASLGGQPVGGGDDGGDDEGGGGPAMKGGVEPGGKAGKHKKGGDAPAADSGGASGDDASPGGLSASKSSKGGGDDGGGKHKHASSKSAGNEGAGDSGGGGVAQKNKKGGGGQDSDPLAAASDVLAGGSASSALGLDDLLGGAINKGASALGDILGLGGDGGGGSSAANKGGPDGGVGGNSGADSATGPGHAVTMCSAAHTESIGSVKATIAAAGIHTIVTGARTQSVGAAHVELAGGSRAESCMSCKTEKSVGLIVVAAGPESEAVGGSRSTTVGGAIIDEIGGTAAIQAGGRVMLVGAFHKIEASGAIVLKCGGSEVVIDGAGVSIKAAAVTLTAPTITLTKAVSEA